MKSFLAGLILAAALAVAGPARAQAPARDKVTFGLDWRAEAEYGGYYQAVATGIYARYGLEVTIRQGGPEVNQAQLLLGGRLDFDLASNSFLALNAVQQKLPLIAVAAFFQKDPAVLIAHPGQGDDSFEALRGKPIMISGATRAGWWNFLAKKFGYTDSQIRPYTFNLQPFLANPKAIQQGYLGSEPYEIAQESGQKPVVLLVADAGFTGYASLLTTTTKYVREHKDVVQRFVDASIEGWASYLNGDPAPGNALIREANPDMTQGLLDYGRAALIGHGIVESGDTKQYGIGTMSQDRWTNFGRSMVAAGLYPKDLDVAAAYTLDFVNKGVGQPARAATAPKAP